MKSLLIVVALVLGGTANCAQGWADRVPRLARVAESFGHADLATRKQFAGIALDTLLYSLRAEFTSAAAHDGAATRRWQAGAWSYVDDLQRLAQRIPNANNIEVTFDPDNVLRIAIDERQVMLNSPRLSQQQRLNADIAAKACDEMNCEEGSAVDVAEDNIERHREVRTEWAFSDRGPPLMSASDGLHCVFKDRADLRLKESSCAAVMEELRTVADALRGAAEHAHVIDWDSFRIEAGEGGSAQVTYNLGGDYFALALPNLVRKPSVWQGARAWLQSRLHGDSGEYFISVAEQSAATRTEFE